MTPILIGLLFAFLSPILFAFMNTLDKFVVSRKVRKPLGFAAVAGIANLIFGIALACFLDWNGIKLSDLLLPLISGGLFGSGFYLYYMIMKEGDASNFVGLAYAYPIFVAILSFIFLGERLSLIGYLGVLLIIIGALMLSIKVHKLSGKKILFMIFLVIIITTIYEFLIKVITNNIPEWNGVSLEFIFIGLAILSGLFFRKVRNDFKTEIKNIRWAFLTEAFTFMAIAATFLAMARLKATIVASIAAIQPLAVIFFENAMERFLGNLKKGNWKSKIISIILIVIGVVVISFEL